MVVTSAAIQADTGELYDAIEGGTTAVNSIIARASDFVKLQSGTTTGYDAVIRPLADAMVTNQVMGGIDPVNKTIGTLQIGKKDLKTMQIFFKQEANKAAVIKGFSLDGLTILFQDSEMV